MEKRVLDLLMPHTDPVPGLPPRKKRKMTLGQRAEPCAAALNVEPMGTTPIPGAWPKGGAAVMSGMGAGKGSALPPPNQPHQLGFGMSLGKERQEKGLGKGWGQPAGPGLLLSQPANPSGVAALGAMVLGQAPQLR